MDESSLISKLQSGNCKNLHSEFVHFFQPFHGFVYLSDDDLNKKKKKKQNDCKKKENKKEPDKTLIHPVAKKFHPFLSRLLCLLPQRILKSPEGVAAEKEQENLTELFKIYRLALDCLSCISCCLIVEPYFIHLKRMSLILCLESRGRHIEAERDGFSLLEDLRLVISKKSQKQKPQEVFCHLPELKNGCVNIELALSVVKIVHCLVRCAAKIASKDVNCYRKVLALVNQVSPWFGVLDSDAFSKYHPKFVWSLHQCALVVARDAQCFDADLVHNLCMMTLKECLKSPSKDLFPEIARSICSSLSTEWEGRPSLVLDILRCGLEAIACECKVNVVNIVNEYLDFVCHFSKTFRTSSTYIHKGAITHLKEMASGFKQLLAPVASILRLYAAGFYFMSGDVLATVGDSNPGETVSRIMLLHDNEENLQYLATSLGFVANYLRDTSSGNGVFFGQVGKNSTNPPCLAESKPEVSKVCNCMHGKISLLSYVNALHFFCKPLAEDVWKHMDSERDVAFSLKLNYVRDVFHLFSDAFLSGIRNISGRDRNRLQEMRKTLFYAPIAALKISLKMDGNIQNSVDCIDRVISITREWIQPQELKFLVSSLFKIGVSLSDVKQYKQASSVLELCYTALWTHVSLLCQKFSDKAEGFPGEDLSEDTIANFVEDACAKTNIFLDVLHHCGSLDRNKVIINSLLGWSVANNLVKNLTAPSVLLKQWVKKICTGFVDVDAVDNAPSLYSLLLNACATWSKTSIGFILEQELLAYAEMKARYQSLCQKKEISADMNALYQSLCQNMQLKVVCILLNDVYILEDYCLQRSRVLIMKAKILKTPGFDGLNASIQCLSEAISVLKGLSGEDAKNTGSCYQLALAYCLHALYIQEADQNSEVILHDISCMLKLLSNISTSRPDSSDGHSELLAGNAILLLYHVTDLLSLKGHSDFLYDIHNLIIILHKLQNIPLENCLAMFWRDRRLTHALCISPVHENFMLTLSQQFGHHVNSINFWTSCMERLPGSLLSFLQKFFLSASVSPVVCDIAVDKIKEAATAMMSCDSAPSHSAFIAGYLYYDLSERLLANGRFFEALTYASEALHLRSKLLIRKFNIQNEHGHYRLEAIGSVITQIQPVITEPHNLEFPILSPWNVLKCYLESALQVGNIHESIGNGAEAESYLVKGKKISCLQDLPIFEVAFASSLGRVYCKKKLWDMAENELNYARQILTGCNSIVSCKRCRLTWEVTMDLQNGDLARNRFDTTLRVRSLKNLPCALDLYRSALEKLNLVDCIKTGEVHFSREEESSVLSGICLSSMGKPSGQVDGHHQSNTGKLCSLMVGGDEMLAKRDAMKSKNSRKASICVLQKGTLKAVRSSRVTRSMNQSCPSDSVHVENELDPKCTSHILEYASSVCHGLEGKFSSTRIDDMKAGGMLDVIYLKWEFCWKRLSVRLLTKIGNCIGVNGETDEVHKIFLQSISLLLNRDPFGQLSCNIPDMLELIGKVDQGDVFTVERATILYHISWFSVKNCLTENSRAQCCCLYDIQMPRIVTWLLQAFILCREHPLLFQKVSRLLAIIFSLSSPNGPFSLPAYSGKALSTSHWAAYFHQASLGSGTCLQHQHLFSMSGKLKSCSSTALKGSHITGSANIVSGPLNSIRFVPEKHDDLEGFVDDFFKGLPCVTVICITLLSNDYTSLLAEILLLPTVFPAWMVLSRLNSKREPVIILLPVDLVPEETECNDSTYSMGFFSESPESTDNWICPWDCAVMDDIAPQFKLILKDNYLSVKTSAPTDSHTHRLTWWTRRRRLNDRLGKFLRDVEDSWFGPWRCLLLGELSESELMDEVVAKLMDDLEHRCRLEINEALLRTILGGALSIAESEECLSQLLLYKGYFGRGGCCGKERLQPLSSHDGVGSVHGLPSQLIREAIVELARITNREPVVLVLDADIQMLPWESLPILRNQEVYRMPSVSSILVTLNKECCHQERFDWGLDQYPSVDPLNAYYLLNPGGDLHLTQIEFEEWFRNQKWEGKAGRIPTTKELESEIASALESHDLFIYLGHGSGTQYIQGSKIQNLDRCAATLLMGCSSGSFRFSGYYAPEGAPFFFLQAGSPAIIANLWDVTDRDIDRFTKAMLDAWLQVGGPCSRCYALSKELMQINIGDNKNRKAPKTRRKALLRGKVEEGNCRSKDCSCKSRFATFMGQARDVCQLPILIGAAPVCYGVPTVVSKRTL